MKADESPLRLPATIFRHNLRDRCEHVREVC
jgi:hypothetical protein